MKFFIDDKEIKTVLKGPVISGSLNSISRYASFSYLYNFDNQANFNYKAKLNSKVEIENDNNKKIFSGRIEGINFEPKTKTVNINAKDSLSYLLETKVKGRYKGTFDAILSKIIGNFNIISKIKTIVQDEINIVSFGDLSLYDILLIASEKVFKDDFKLYVDGDSKLNILLPLVGESKLDLVFGQNIISSSFSINNEGSSSNITAIGDSSVVSGSIIRLIEPESGLSGYFIVEKDTHNFSDVYTMTLSIKERKFDV